MSRHASDEFAAVALSFLSALYNAAWRLAGNEHDAEDLVQDTYAQAFRHAAELRHVSRCRAWIFRIPRNRFRSAERGRHAPPELVVLEGGLEAAEAGAAPERLPQIERAAAARLARPAIVEALGRLPEEHRTASSSATSRGSPTRRSPRS